MIKLMNKFVQESLGSKKAYISYQIKELPVCLGADKYIDFTTEK